MSGVKLSISDVRYTAHVRRAWRAYINARNRYRKERATYMRVMRHRGFRRPRSAFGWDAMLTDYVLPLRADMWYRRDRVRLARIESLLSEGK